MTLPEITQALCLAIARHDMKAARSICAMAAAKMGEPRASVIGRAFETGQLLSAAPAKKMKFWSPVAEPRAPWVPESVSAAIAGWIEQVQFAQALVEAGEKVLPMLLTGETRCGKTSSLCAVATTLGLPVYRMSLADVVGSHLGECAKFMRDALAEMKGFDDRAIWLIDEIDAIGFKRGSETHSATQERNHAVGSLLTELESLPMSTPLVATSNASDNMDSAVLARFEVVEFPGWKNLTETQRALFGESHGYAAGAAHDSYATVVKAARKERVDAILVQAKQSPPLTLEMS